MHFKKKDIYFIFEMQGNISDSFLDPSEGSQPSEGSIPTTRH